MLSSQISAVTNFVRYHKTALAVIATATPLIALQVRNASILNTFLGEHNLTDAYHAED